MAVLPLDSDAPCDTRAILSVAYAGELFVQLQDGRVFSEANSRLVSLTGDCHIVLATRQHLAAIHSS